MIRQPSKSPKLRMKAAENRRMISIVMWLTRNVYKPQDDHDRLVFDCLSALFNFYSELK